MTDNRPAKDMVFGINTVMEALHSDQEIDRILIQKGINSDALKEIIVLARSLNVPVQQVPIERLNKVTRKNHQGAIAFMAAILYASLDNVIDTAYSEGRIPFILALDKVTDVRNFGGIARTAECAGVDAILIPDMGSAKINSDAMKTSSGALHHIPVCREKSLYAGLRYLQQSGLKIVACTEKAKESLYTQQFTDPVVVVMGSEEDGISEDILKIADIKVSIPMAGKVGSLNVSVATGIILFEILKARTEAISK